MAGRVELSPFTGRSVLIVSPQPWGELHISKHHYALELARQGARVLFLEPPRADGGFDVEPVAPGVSRVGHALFFPSWLRFKVRPLFDLFMLVHLSALRDKLERHLGGALDIVWCFDPNLYRDLSWFGATQRIFHPVDPIVEEHQRRPADRASLLLSVSDRILGAFAGRAPGVPRAVVNHGIHDALRAVAERALSSPLRAVEGRPVRFGYVGNLARADVDRTLLLDIVDRHPEAQFVFWGPTGDSNLGRTDPLAAAFIAALRSRSNVQLRGSRRPDELALELESGADAFLLLYRFLEGRSDRSNAHKLIEYLATGKPIVSVRVDHYKDRPDLVWMPGDEDDAKVVPLVGRVLGILSGAEGPEALEVEDGRRLRRCRYALTQTYSAHLATIAGLLAAQGAAGAERALRGLPVLDSPQSEAA